MMNIQLYVRGLARSSLWLLVFLVLGLVACGEPEFRTIPEEGVILAFGDSLTVGVGARGDSSYPSVLADLTGRQVINAGVSGETTQAGLPRLEKILAAESVDLLILLEGGNDILRNQNLENTKRNLAAMIQMAKRSNIDVLLIGVPEKNLFSKVAPIYDELAAEFDVVYERELLSKLLKSPSYKSDAVHLNDQGYQKMAEAIFERLRKLGAL